MNRPFAILLVYVAALVAVADAQPKPSRVGPEGVPLAEYERARETLARAVIAEEGWNDPQGHAAVAWVYARKWARRSRPTTTLESIITRHCSALRPGRSSTRAALMSGLPGTVDAWPGKREAWQRTLLELDAWYAGRVPDPCSPAKPTDFGAANDRPPVGARRVECRGADSVFYEVRR